ncbi:MAG: WD40 repeat domain-containing protein [Anaerolineales bacterium]|nr:WD40 repeat domain-containing protein [Anaerolineales bacterium]
MQKRQRVYVLFLLVAMLLQGCLPAKLDETPEPTAFPTPVTPDHLSTPGEDFPYVYVMGNGTIQDLDYSPDSSLLAVSSGSTVTIFSSDSMEVAKKLSFGSRVLAASWSPDGTKLAVGLLGGVTEIHETDTWSYVNSFTSSIRMTDLGWNFDGTLLASTAGEYLFVNDAASGENLFAERDSAGAVVWAPDRNQLYLRAEGYYDKARLLDVDTMEIIEADLNPDFASLSFYDAEWVRNGELEQLFLLITNYYYEEANYTAQTGFDAETGINTFVYEIPAGQFEIIIEKNQMVLSDSDGNLIVESINGNSSEEIIAAHSGSILAMDIDISGTLLSTAGSDGVLKIWDTSSWAILWSSEGYYPSFTFMEFIDSSTIAGASINSADIFFLDPNTGELLERIPTPLNSITSLAFLSDHDLFAVSYVDQSYVEGYSENGSSLQIYTMDGVLKTEFTYEALGVCWSERDNALYTWNDEELARWDADSFVRSSIADLTSLFERAIPTIYHSPDCSQIAVPQILPEEVIVFIDLQTGSKRRVEYEAEHALLNVAWSPDLEMLLCSDQYGSVAVMDGETRNIGAFYEVSPSGSGVSNISWSPDNKLTAISTFDGRILVFDPNSGVVKVQLQVPEAVQAISWLEDGKEIAAALADGTILLWPMDDLNAEMPGGES